jgi:hypothetical protein
MSFIIPNIEFNRYNKIYSNRSELIHPFYPITIANLNEDLDKYKNINFPPINSSTITDFSYGFSGSAIKFFPKLDTSNATKLDYIASSCYDLVVVDGLKIPRNCSAKYLFNGCGKLRYVRLIIESCTTQNLQGFVNECRSLKEIIIEGKISVNSNSLSLIHTDLSVNSLLSILNSFYDNTGHPATCNVNLG